MEIHFQQQFSALLLEMAVIDNSESKD